MSGKVKLKTWTYIDDVWTCMRNSYVMNNNITCPGCMVKMDDHAEDVEIIVQNNKDREYYTHDCGVKLCLIK